jgi:O-antigen/teichoic acid export membrane protein
MSNIRVTYSALISLFIRLISILSGTIFTLIVTRQLSVEEFGTWALISGIVIYAVIINPIINYWSTREIARGEKSGSTAIFSTGFFTIGGIVIYLVMAYFVGIESDVDLDILLFAVILIPVMFFNDVLTAINVGHKPHVTSYGFLVFEIIKILAAIILIYFLKMGLEGVIAASFFAYLGSIVILAIYAKPIVQSNFQQKYLKKWFKLFWLPTYRNLPSLISLSDVLIFSIVTGSVVGVAYYTAAKTIGVLVNHTRSFSKGLYPKLLESQRQEYLQETLIKMLYFAFPLISLSIVFAKPGLFALNPIYQGAATIVIFISIKSFLTTINKVFFQSLQGMENVDIKEESTFQDYLKSKLMWFPTFEIIRHGVYIIILFLMLNVLISEDKSEFELVLYWAIIGLIVEIPLTIYIIRLVRKTFTLKIDFISLIKYIIISVAVFGGIHLVMEEFLEYKNRIFEFLPVLMLFALIGVIGYLGLTYVSDKKTKILFNAVLHELINKIRK